jgi:hypothetical protein
VSKTFKNIFGFCDFHDLYREVAEQLNTGDAIAEVGVMYGHSAAFMTECLRAQNKRVTYYVVDRWDDVGVPEFHVKNDVALTEQFGPNYTEDIKKDPNLFYKKFLRNMNETGNLPYITPLKLSSIEAAEFVPDNTLSFCFIDAMHTYEAVLEDIKVWRKKVIPGGILAGHDYPWTGVKKAVDEIFPNVNVIGTSWWINV